MSTSKKFKYDVVAFAPHPDDAEIFCGGTLLRLSSLGYRTAIVDLSEGELGTQGSVEIRRTEAKRAAEILGLSHRENLGIPDGHIGSPGADFESQVREVVAAIRRLRPETILIPYWQGRHPDHPGSSDLLTRAAFHSGLKNYDVGTDDAACRPNQVLYYQMRYQFRPSFVVNISEVWEQKLEAIHCYSSQITAEKEPEGDFPQPLISAPLSLHSLEARDTYYGSMIGVEHGEPFLMKTAIGISDPVRFLRDNPNQAAFLFPEAS